MTAPDPEERLTALMAEVLQQREELDELKDREKTTHGLLVALATDVARLVQDRDSVPSTPCWVDLDQDAAAKAWKALGEWVNGVLLVRYPQLASKGKGVIPSCWYRHTAMVEELSALHVAWCYAYRDTGAPPNAAIEWQKRLHETRPRLRGMSDCKDEHEDDLEPVETTDPNFEGYVMADVLNRPVKPAEGE